jgi:hypothetical protein
MRHCKGKKPGTEASVLIAAKSVIMIARQTEPSQRLTGGQIALRAIDISDLDVKPEFHPTLLSISTLEAAAGDRLSISLHFSL